VRGPRFKSQDNYFSISIAVSLRSFPESPDLDFFSNGASRDCVTKCDLQRNLQRQRLKQLLRSTVNTPNHGFRHCGVNKLPVAQNVMVTVCGRAEWHQSIMTSPLHLVQCSMPIWATMVIWAKLRLYTRRPVFGLGLFGSLICYI
jgi:hypothetical protein